MADNIVAGGNTVATDDIGGVHHQRVKIMHGADGAATDASAAAPLPVGDALSLAQLQAIAAALLGTLTVGGTIAVTGVATAANQATANGSLATLAGAVAGTEVQVDVLSLPALPAGNNSIGGTQDNGPQWTTVFGVSGARFTSANQSAADAAVTDAPTAGQKLVITDVLISVDTAMRVDLKEETSGTVFASIYLPANGTIQFTPRSRLKLATADKKLMVRTSASGNVAVTAFAFSEA